MWLCGRRVGGSGSGGGGFCLRGSLDEGAHDCCCWIVVVFIDLLLLCEFEIESERGN